MTKAGKVLAHHYPWMTCIHGAKHVIALFCSDVANLGPVRRMLRFARQVYMWFSSGAHHKAHALFTKHSNTVNGKKIGCMKYAATRMGESFYALLRILRLKDTFQFLLADPQFKALKGSDAPPGEMIQILKRDDLYIWLFKFLRPMYAVLRLL